MWRSEYGVERARRIMNLEKRCLGLDCDRAGNCKSYLRHQHPHAVLFMPSERGLDCHSYDPRVAGEDEEAWLDKMQQLAG